MIRQILRTISRFTAAVVLLSLSLCAVEVWFRWERLNASTLHSTQANSLLDVVQPHPTTFLAVSPLLDLEMPTGLTETTRLQTNEFGLRGGEVLVPKPASLFRVICIGGSGIFGLGIRQEETVPFQIEKLFHENGLGHVEFLNAACPGCGPLANLLRLRQHLMILEPDLILFCASPDDVTVDADVRGGLTLSSDGSPAYASHPFLEGTAINELDRLSQEFATVDLLIQKAGPYLGLKTNEKLTEAADAETSPDLTPFINIWDLTKALECRFIISIVPNAWTIKPAVGQVQSRNASAFERDLQTVFAERGISTLSLIHNPIELFQQMSNSPQPDQQAIFREQNGQLTPYGISLYARSIAKSLVDFHPEILTKPQQPASLPQPLPTSPLDTNIHQRTPSQNISDRNGITAPLLR